MTYVTLHDRLRGPIADALKKKLSIKNTHALPHIEKVVVNVGINKSKMDSKEMHEYIEQSLMKITGQKPVFTRAKKAISNFKTRENMIVGCMVTLRGQKMEEFLDRLLSYGLPRIRDFRGLPRNLDGHGNYSIGIRDHSIFPEVPAPDAKQIFGFQVVISTTADNDEEAMALFTELGMPFRKVEKGKRKEEKENEKGESKKEKEEVAKVSEGAEVKDESEQSDEVANEANEASEAKEADKKEANQTLESDSQPDDTDKTSEPNSQSPTPNS